MGTPNDGNDNPFISGDTFGSESFGGTSAVQTTYQPPPVSGAWSSQPQLEDDDVEPFTMAHLTAQDSVVPAISVSTSPAGATISKQADHTTLTFTGRQSIEAVDA